MISSRCRKRKMPIDINQDESQVKRVLTSSKAIGSAQPRLAIQTTAPLGYYDGYHDALSSSPLQADNIGYPLNPGFDFGTRLLTAVQSGQFSEYTHPSSESTAGTTTAPLPSDVLGDHRVMARHSTGYPQAPTPADTNYAGSPAAPTPSVEGPNSNSRETPRRKAPVQAGKPEEEEAPVYYCDQCPREFPRPCDLTWAPLDSYDLEDAKRTLKIENIRKPTSARLNVMMRIVSTILKVFRPIKSVSGTKTTYMPRIRRNGNAYMHHAFTKASVRAIANNTWKKHMVTIISGWRGIPENDQSSRRSP